MLGEVNTQILTLAMLDVFSLNNILLKYSTLMQYIHCQWIQDLTVS